MQLAVSIEITNSLLLDPEDEPAYPMILLSE